MTARVIYTIGYGKRTTDELLTILADHHITYLIDVRSSPYSKFKPEFSKTSLQPTLAQAGIRYVFMGDLIGGTPEDPVCYTDGKADYDKIAETERYQKGIARLLSAFEQNLSICLMCSEGKPELCHRSKLIGNTLKQKGIPVLHINEENETKTQEYIMNVIEGWQMTLFDMPLLSRKTYSMSENKEEE
ncbi:MAG: DUF488 domain-containing protein [Candidatus Omnitrophota bacterium]|jgi:uncharacterized protein (DUF488 family)|nr:MAG: DUF488 domain-containing protein [Candidatus Omnitrophota bacterium]